MNRNKRNLINKLIAILMVIFLNLTDFLFVGKNLITYAIDVQDNISAILTSKEKYIYKGKIYTGEETVYTTNAQITINNIENADNIYIKESESKFLKDDAEISANSIYNAIKINKQELIKIFGEDVEITVYGQDSKEIATINGEYIIESEYLTESNKEVNVSEEDIITINFPEETKTVYITTSKPIDVGTLNIENEKKISSSDLSKNEIDSLTKIKEELMVKQGDKLITKNSEIELKNPSTKAMLDVSTDTLLSEEGKQKAKIAVVLKNSKEEDELYQNPNIKIICPSYVTGIDATYSLLYANGLKIENTEIVKENDNLIIQIKLTGTQSKYNPEIIVGTTLIIDALLDIDESKSNTDEEITLNYTNEIATSYENEGIQKSKISLKENDGQTSFNVTESKEQELEESWLPTDNVSGPRISANIKAYVGEKQIVDGDTVNSGEIIKYKLTIKNTGSVDTNNINIDVNTPEGTKIVQYVKATENEEQEEGDILFAIKDYYKETEVSNNKMTKKIDKLQTNEEITLTYDVKVTEEKINNQISTNATITYSAEENTSTSFTSDTNTISNKISKADINMSMVMLARGDVPMQAGEFYGYELTVKNNSANELSNVNIDIIINSGYVLDRVIDETDEILPSENNRFVIESLNADEEKVYIIQVEATGNSQKATISTIANNLYHSNEIEEKIKTENELEITVTSENEGKVIKDGDNVSYNIKITNKGERKIETLDIVEKISTYLDISKITINGQETEYDVQYLETEEKEESTLEESDSYLIGFRYENPIDSGESISIIVETSTDSETQHLRDIHLSSYVEVKAPGNTIKSEQINHILKSTSIIKDDDNEDIYQNDTQNQNTYTISGTAWIDKNKNGERNANEEGLSGVKVKLINLQNSETKETTTTENGFYAFTELTNGDYITIYEYDNEEYLLTKYQKDGVIDTRNSKVENVILSINGKETKVSSTDILIINNDNLGSIDLGLLDTNVRKEKETEDDAVTNDEDNKLSTSVIVTYIAIFASIIVIIVIGAYMLIRKKQKKDIDL